MLVIMTGHTVHFATCKLSGLIIFAFVVALAAVCIVVAWVAKNTPNTRIKHFNNFGSNIGRQPSAPL